MSGGDGLARRFHESYERLAPSFGYETRRESAVPWEDVPEQNRRLMVAVCEEVTAALRAKAAAVDRVRELAEDLESYVAARGLPATGTYDDGLNRAQAAAAADLRRALYGPAPC